MRQTSKSTSSGLGAGLTAVVTLLALALCAVAFAQNRSVVRGLVWPGFDIQFRELASAQTMLDQGYGPDADYPSEHVWYNPMASWIIAAASRLSGSAAPGVVSRLGPYVNLAAPAALFLLTALLFDSVAAMATVAAFIFLVGTEFPFYNSATYSPWFAPETFGQAWLYLLLGAQYRAVRPAASLGWSAASGALLGLTFLTHTAPALLGGAVIVVLGVIDMRRPGGARAGLTRIGVALGVALLVSLPFDFEILWRYHLKIINQFPSQSPSSLLDLNELPSLARTIAVPALVAAAALGLRAATRMDLGMRVLLAWLGVVAALLAANVGRLLLDKAGIHLPPVVAAFHFFSYLMTIVAIGVGVGIRDGSAALVRRLSLVGHGRWSESGMTGGLVACGVTLLLVVAAYPRYLRRQDFTDVRQEAAAMNERFPIDVVDWIRAHTSPDDVFLCTDDASLYIVPPAGRKVVSTNRYFSNPYVDWVTRDADRSRMFDQLGRGDIDGFRTLAAKYGVRFILLTRDRSVVWLRVAGLRPRDLPDVEPASLSALPAFGLVFENDRFTILAVRPASPAPLATSGGGSSIGPLRAPDSD